SSAVSFSAFPSIKVPYPCFLDLLYRPFYGAHRHGPRWNALYSCTKYSYVSWNIVDYSRFFFYILLQSSQTSVKNITDYEYYVGSDRSATRSSAHSNYWNH